MARRVLADFDSELLLRLGNRTDITSAQRGFFLQDAARMVANGVDDVALQARVDLTLANGSDTLDPTAAPNTTQDVWWPIALKNMTDGFFIQPDDKQRIDMVLTKPSGPPNIYYWYAGKYIFDTLANAVKTIRLWYKQKPVEFTVSPSTDSVFDPIIVMLACRLGLESVRDYDEAMKQRQLIGNYIKDYNLPINLGKLDDYRQGFQVKLR